MIVVHFDFTIHSSIQYALCTMHYSRFIHELKFSVCRERKPGDSKFFETFETFRSNRLWTDSSFFLFFRNKKNGGNGEIQLWIFFLFLFCAFVLGHRCGSLGLRWSHGRAVFALSHNSGSRRGCCGAGSFWVPWGCLDSFVRWSCRSSWWPWFFDVKSVWFLIKIFLVWFEFI